LVTSTVMPLRAVRTSPGRIAEAPGMFSTRGRMAVTAVGSSSSAAAVTAARMAAAPAMSSFMPSMPAPRLRSIPPVSKVTPLPTRATCRLAPGGR
jgi:hypothetical protein